MFKYIAKDVDEVVDEIKVLSWTWNLHRLKTAPCLFYEWCWDPGDCLRRQTLRRRKVCIGGPTWWLLFSRLLLFLSDFEMLLTSGQQRLQC